MHTGNRLTKQAQYPTSGKYADNVIWCQHTAVTCPTGQKGNGLDPEGDTKITSVENLSRVSNLKNMQLKSISQSKARHVSGRLKQTRYFLKFRKIACKSNPIDCWQPLTVLTYFISKKNYTLAKIIIRANNFLTQHKRFGVKLHFHKEFTFDWCNNVFVSFSWRLKQLLTFFSQASPLETLLS